MPPSRHQTNPAFHEARVAAHTAYQDLEAALDMLGRAIAADAGRPALVHALPWQGSTDAGEPAGMPAWNAAPLEGQAARDHAIAEIGRTRCHYHQHPATVTRAPGAIASSQVTIDAARAVNAAKEAFWTAAQRISPRAPTRRRELHGMIPRISLMQTRRHLLVWDRKPDRIHFTWAAHTTSTRALTVGEMDHELIRRLRRGPPEGYDRERWRALLEYGRACLEELPETEPVAIQTPMAPHVRAHVYWGWQRPVSAAPLPFLYPDDGTGPPPIRPLPAFDPTAESARHADRTLEDEPLVEGLRLYRYRPEHRGRKAA